MPENIDFDALSPMMQHYLDTKKKYPDCILFYRLGDFYEMFFEDAVTVSRELELTLTGKSCGLPERAPMCGVPFHSADTYISRLIKKGYKVAVCEQLEDPKTAKGMVKRDVIRVISPGTTLDNSFLDENRNNYIMCVYASKNRYGIAICDVSTGDFYVTEVADAADAAGEIMKFYPSEMLVNPGVEMPEEMVLALESIGIKSESLSEDYFSLGRVRDTLLMHFKVSDISGLGIGDYDEGVTAAGALMYYIREMLKADPSNITNVMPYNNGLYMLLDTTAVRNLELIETLREKKKTGSLLGVLDRTKTAMGARKLRELLEKPLLDKAQILSRLDAVSELTTEEIAREEMRNLLNKVYDLERLVTRIAYKTANPRDMLSFRDSIGVLSGLKEMTSGLKAQELKSINEKIDDLGDIYDDISKAVSDEAPQAFHDGGIIKDGYSSEVDSLRLLKTDGKKYLAGIEERERERTGIKNLRIKYNKVFGYYLEVTNSFLDQVPDYFIRKQTLINAERFITPELKEMEEKLLTASERLNALEYALFDELREKIASDIGRIKQTAKGIAMLDVFLSLAHVAVHNRYVRPAITEDGEIVIKKGRHPVVESMNRSSRFVPNDVSLNSKDERIAVITGPNMAGKSTYMRQCALIVLMAQMGSFVPAEEADISICDRIFTRVGASDDLAGGQSTFMVEMTEVSNILRHASKDSLLILDEIGRGTSTFDGLSIAWAVIEYIAQEIGAKALFATHYHELTKLQGKLYGVKNYRIAVREQGHDIIFLRKIMPGGADKSYGISVAALAGVPEAVLSRARLISAELSGYNSDSVVEMVTERSMSGQLSFFDMTAGEDASDEDASGEDAGNEDGAGKASEGEYVSEVQMRLRDIEPDELTPKEALAIIYELKELEKR